MTDAGSPREAAVAPEPAGPEGVRALRAHDVRHDRERADRRHLVEATRRLLRVGVLVFLDTAVSALALAAAVHLGGGNPEQWSRLLVVVLVVQVLSLFAARSYDAGVGRNDPNAHLRGVVSAVLLLTLLMVVPSAIEMSLQQLALFGIIGYVGLELERVSVQAGVKRLRQHGYLLRPAIIIGDAEEATQIVELFQRLSNADLRFVGRISASRPADATALASLNELEATIYRHSVRTVVISGSVPPDRAHAIVPRIFDAGASVLAAPSAVGRMAALAGAYPLYGAFTAEFQPPQLRLPEFTLKRALDIALTSLALLVLSPLFAVIAVAIKLDSRGPAMFRQVRLGVGGRPFWIWKFRTMCVDAEERKPGLAHLNEYNDARLFKIRDDPRITRVGGFLRRTSLDELPQLLNVLRGEMSLVGPRPPLPQEVAEYGEEHLVRLTVMPGLTGPWQANGRNNVLDFDEVVRMEREYIRNWSLLLDLKILARTLVSVLRREGAH